MTLNEKNKLLSCFKMDMTDSEIVNVIDGIFEKVIQTTVQPLAVVPSSTWDKWDDFVINNRIKEKFAKLLTRQIIENHSSFMILPGSDNDPLNKVDVLLPVSTGKIAVNRAGTQVKSSYHVISNQTSLIYDAPMDTEALAFIKKGDQVLHMLSPVTKSIQGDYNKVTMNPNSFIPFPDHTIVPIVWFYNPINNVLKQMIQANKKAAFKVFKEILAQLKLSGGNIMFIGSSNNVTSEANAKKKAILGDGRVNVVNESLNKSMSNPIVSINNQPYFDAFWSLIDSMVNSLIEGLQVGDLNGGGAGTKNMHTTEVVSSFGVKAQKIINIQGMYISSWKLFAKILKEYGLPVPGDIEFSYDAVDNVLIDNLDDNPVPSPVTPITQESEVE